MSVNIQTSNGLVKIAGTPTIDTTLSNVSKNPVQNKVVTTKIDEINRKLSGIKEGAETTAATISGSNPTVTNSANAPLIYLKNSGYTEQETLSGINLFDAISVYNEKDGYSVSDDGTITATVTDDVREWKYTNCECKMTLSSGTYHIKLLNDSVTEHGYAGFYVILTDDTLYRGSDYKAMWNTEYPFTLTEDTDIGIIIKPFTNTFKVMLTKDIDITEYEPYCGGVASPNPDYPQDIKGLGDSVTIEVKTCGKNLLFHSLMSGTECGLTRELNDDGSLTFIGTTTNQITYLLDDIISRLKVGETYIWSGVTNVKIVEGGTNLYKGGGGSYTITENTTSFMPYFQWNSVGTTLNTTFYPMVRIKGTDDTYEPYTETTATIPIDTLYEGDYLEVYADGSGKIVQENDTKVFNGSEYWVLNTEVTKGVNLYLLSKGVTGITYTPESAKSNLYPYDKYYHSSELTKDRVFCIDLNNVVIRDNVFTSVTEFKTFLGSNNLHIVYKREEPIETPLTAEQVQAFKQLYTFDNVTNFFCDGEITARYYVNTDSGDTVGMLQEQVKENLEQIKNDLGGLSFSVNGSTLTITNGTKTWTLT